jgi:Fe-S oxidoreductase
MALASLLVYNHYTNKAKEEAIENNISERAQNIQNLLNGLISGNDDELSLIRLCSELYALDRNVEFQKHIHSSHRIWDALFHDKDKVRANAEELIAIYALVETDYRNPEIQNRLNQVLNKIWGS